MDLWRVESGSCHGTLCTQQHGPLPPEPLILIHTGYILLVYLPFYLFPFLLEICDEACERMTWVLLETNYERWLSKCVYEVQVLLSILDGYIGISITVLLENKYMTCCLFFFPRDFTVDKLKNQE